MEGADVFLNPPYRQAYSNGKKAFMSQACGVVHLMRRHRDRTATIVMRNNGTISQASWFEPLLQSKRYAALCLLRGRVKFQGDTRRRYSNPELGHWHDGSEPAEGPQTWRGLRTGLSAESYREVVAPYG